MKETEHTITDTETDTHSSRRFRPKRTIAAAVFVVVVMCLMGAFYRDPSTFAPSSYLNRGSTDIAAVVEAEANSTSPVPISFTKLPETSPGPKGREIVLLMASDNGQQGNPIPYHHERAYENRKEFADWHGYTLENYNFDDFSVEEGVHVIWKKILAIKRAFDNNPDAEWVFWLDLDVILMTSHIPLSTYLLAPSVLQSHLLLNTSIMGNSERVTPYDQSAKDVDLIMAQDHNGPNAGVMLLRRSEWTETLLDLWMDPLFIAQDFVSSQTAMESKLYTNACLASLEENKTFCFTCSRSTTTSSSALVLSACETSTLIPTAAQILAGTRATCWFILPVAGSRMSVSRIGRSIGPGGVQCRRNT